MAAISVNASSVSNDYKRLLIGLLQDIMCFMVGKGALLYRNEAKSLITPSFVPRNTPTPSFGGSGIFLPTPYSICPSYDHLSMLPSPRIRAAGQRLHWFPFVKTRRGFLREIALLWGRIVVSCWKEPLLEDSESQCGFSI